jgi:hypothetical protein
MSAITVNNDKLNQLCVREFGPYNIINTVAIPISSNTLINIKDYFTHPAQNSYGISNIRLAGDWDYYNFIIGTQLITHIDKSNNMYSYVSDIGAIPYSNIQNYYLDVHVSGNAILTFDNIKFEEPLQFSNSNINNLGSYYVKKIITQLPHNSSNGNGPRELVKRDNYLRFMSDCVGLAF